MADRPAKRTKHPARLVALSASVTDVDSAFRRTVVQVSDVELLFRVATVTAAVPSHRLFLEVDQAKSTIVLRSSVPSLNVFVKSEAPCRVESMTRTLECACVDSSVLMHVLSDNRSATVVKIVFFNNSEDLMIECVASGSRVRRVRMPTFEYSPEEDQVVALRPERTTILETDLSMMRRFVASAHRDKAPFVTIRTLSYDQHFASEACTRSFTRVQLEYGGKDTGVRCEERETVVAERRDADGPLGEWTTLADGAGSALATLDEGRLVQRHVKVLHTNMLHSLLGAMLKVDIVQIHLPVERLFQVVFEMPSAAPAASHAAAAAAASLFRCQTTVGAVQSSVDDDSDE